MATVQRARPTPADTAVKATAPASRIAGKAREEKEPLGIASWFRRGPRRHPDWSFAGFEAACALAFEIVEPKDWTDTDELCEFISYSVGQELNQKNVETFYVARDRKTNRPFLLVMLADRHRIYRECAVTVVRS